MCSTATSSVSRPCASLSHRLIRQSTRTHTFPPPLFLHNCRALIFSLSAPSLVSLACAENSSARSFYGVPRRHPPPPSFFFPFFTPFIHSLPFRRLGVLKNGGEIALSRMCPSAHTRDSASHNRNRCLSLSSLLFVERSEIIYT